MAVKLKQLMNLHDKRFERFEAVITLEQLTNSITMPKTHNRGKFNTAARCIKTT